MSDLEQRLFCIREVFVLLEIEIENGGLMALQRKTIQVIRIIFILFVHLYLFVTQFFVILYTPPPSPMSP